MNKAANIRHPILVVHLLNRMTTDRTGYSTYLTEAGQHENTKEAKECLHC